MLQLVVHVHMHSLAAGASSCGSGGTFRRGHLTLQTAVRSRPQDSAPLPPGPKKQSSSRWILPSLVLCHRVLQTGRCHGDGGRGRGEEQQESTANRLLWAWPREGGRAGSTGGSWPGPA